VKQANLSRNLWNVAMVGVAFLLYILISWFQTPAQSHSRLPPFAQFFSGNLNKGRTVPQIMIKQLRVKVVLNCRNDLFVWWNQLDALLIFSLLSHYTSKSFGLASSPSSGSSDVYMWQSVRAVRLSRVSAGLDVMNCDYDLQHLPIVTHIHCSLLMMGY
jgi:hypothetical protein